MQYLKSILWLPIVVSLLFSCEESITPVITTIAADMNEMLVTDSIMISCSAEDGDSDSLSYHWIASSGRIIGSGSSIKYTGVLEELPATITCRVSDDDGNETSGIVEVLVYGLETGTVADIDGNIYQTIKIGTQEWMAENLKVLHYQNGDPIPLIINDTVWSEQNSGAYGVYDNDDSCIDEYGLLYNWHAVNDTRGLAPEGWHVPSLDELNVLFDLLGGTEVAGGKMKVMLCGVRPIRFI